MTDPSETAAKIFRWSAVYGFVVLAPMYLMEGLIGAQHPPAITHPEFFYGFIGVALAFQFVFWLIAQDPVRYKPMMLPSMLEKFSYAIAVGVLVAGGRAPLVMAAPAALDCAMGFAFIWAFINLPSE